MTTRITEHKPGSLNDAFEAVRLVRERMTRTLSALRDAGVRHALAGGNAVAEWIRSAVDGNERSTPNVDVIIDPDHFATARTAMEQAGFLYRPGRAFNDFTDDANSEHWQRRTVHLLCSGSKFENGPPVPPLSEISLPCGRPTLPLQALVENKFDVWRGIERVHLDDLIDSGLIDKTWLDRLSAERSAKLRHLYATFTGSFHGSAG